MINARINIENLRLLKIFQPNGKIKNKFLKNGFSTTLKSCASQLIKYETKIAVTLRPEVMEPHVRRVQMIVRYYVLRNVNSKVLYVAFCRITKKLSFPVKNVLNDYRYSMHRIRI